MRVFSLLVASAICVSAQSHPSWWNWASPDATALVGVHWEAVRSSAISAALAEELGPDGDLGLPALPCLSQTKQFLLSSPSFLVVATGDFSPQELRTETAAQSMKPAPYKGIDLWISPGKSTLSLARINDHLLLLGFHRTLEAAIDRNQEQSNQTAADRHYSPLLMRAARFSGEDLWVVASQLPDDLASRFVPLEVEAHSFEGSATLTDGIRLEGTLAAGSQAEAAGIAAKLHQLAPGLPSIARGLQVVQAGDMVVLTMVASRDQVAASLRSTPAAAPVSPSAAMRAAAVPAEATEPTPMAALPVPPQVAAKPAPVNAPAQSAVPAPVVTAAATPAPAPPPAAGPRIVRILGLDDGPREIVLPPLSR